MSYRLGHIVLGRWRLCRSDDKCLGCQLHQVAIPDPTPTGWKAFEVPAGERRHIAP